VAIKPSLTRRTEATRHGAPSLRADTHGCPVGVEHEHGLDLVAVVGLPEPFERLTLVCALLLNLLQRQRCLGLQMRSKLFRDVREFFGQLEALVQALPDLVDSILGFAIAKVTELISVQVVERAHEIAKL